jgi:hypothetical protein
VRAYLCGELSDLKDTRPLVVVPFFAPVKLKDDGTPNIEEGRKVRQLLDHWRKKWDASGCGLDVACITELVGPGGWAPLWVNIDQFKERGFVRPNQAFDYKGAQVLAALLTSPRPMLVMDADAFVVDAKRLERWVDVMMTANVPFATVPDGWVRPIETRLGKTVHQRQAGVMWFGGGKDLHARIVALYCSTWNIVAEQFADGEEWLEQLVWSAVWADMGAHQMPADVNVPHIAKPEQLATAAVLHVHGPRKWEYIAGQYDPMHKGETCEPRP